MLKISLQYCFAIESSLYHFVLVNIVCCGEKLNRDMTLKEIQLRWKSHLPHSGEGKVKWELEQAMIQLGYIRSKKLQTPPKK